MSKEAGIPVAYGFSFIAILPFSSFEIIPRTLDRNTSAATKTLMHPPFWVYVPREGGAPCYAFYDVLVVTFAYTFKGLTEENLESRS